jgi:hypothetical protein
LLPRWFYKVHSRFKTPIRTILVFGAIGMALAFIGELTFVADLYNYGALLSYILVNVCLIVLRNKEATAYRSWKIPGAVNIRFGSRAVTIPLISVVGAVSCAALWSLILTFHEGGRILGTAWILIGIVGFVALRRMKHMPIWTAQTGKRILPGGYIMNAVVLVRIPEDEAQILNSIRGALDKRFHITLLNILDPMSLALSTERLSDYSQIKQYQNETLKDLQSIAAQLRSDGYQVTPRVEIGSFTKTLDEEASAEKNDVFLLLKRKTIRRHIEKGAEDSALAVLSKYPGKVMIARRSK